AYAPAPLRAASGSACFTCAATSPSWGTPPPPALDQLGARGAGRWRTEPAGAHRREVAGTEMTTMTTAGAAGAELTYSDGIAAARTMLALEGNAAALQRRLPSGWELAPFAGDDLRGTSLRGANLLVPFHEVYALRAREGQPAGLPQLSYVAF